MFTKLFKKGIAVFVPDSHIAQIVNRLCENDRLSVGINKAFGKLLDAGEKAVNFFAKE